MTNFNHLQSAHCETGVIASLFTHAGLELSEPMAFGLGSGLAFAYLPFIKLAGQPLVAYRMPPLYILKKVCASLGVKLISHQFKDEQLGQEKLDECLNQGKLVGLQTSVYWLPYFPEEMRFHFNAHNLLVYGKEADEYLISDPVVEYPVRCSVTDLNLARFAKGVLAPKGRLYYLASKPQEPDWDKLITTSIKASCRILTGMPLPWIGTRGIHHLGKKIAKLNPSEHRKNSLYLTHLVRMQEEIGTGGAGFRFMYASFLQEAANKIGNSVLTDLSLELTQIGDNWREFALACVEYSRNKQSSQQQLTGLAKQLTKLAAAEKNLYRQLNKAVG